MTPAQKIRQYLESRPNQWVMGYEIEKLSIQWGEKPSVVMRRARELVHNDPCIEASLIYYEPARRKVVAYRYVAPRITPPPTGNQSRPLQASFFPPVERKPDYTKI